MSSVVDAAPSSGGLAYLRLSRPKQWIKNALVLAAPAAAGDLFHGPVAWRAAVAFAAFCLAASGVYWINDSLDADADRRHPRKRFRPVAAGLVGERVALVGGVALIAAGAAFALTTGHPWTTGVIGIYAFTSLAYSIGLKRVAVVDLVIVALGFVLRAIAGATAVDVPVSNWFLLCTSFGSLFIVTGKRYGELVEVGEDAASVRATLDRYDGPFLRLVMGVACSACVVAYCLWAFEKADLPNVDHHLFEISIIPMVTALLRYLLVIESGAGAAPEEVFLSDRALQLVGLAWVAVFGTAVAIG